MMNSNCNTVTSRAQQRATSPFVQMLLFVVIVIVSSSFSSTNNFVDASSSTIMPVSADTQRILDNQHQQFKNKHSIRTVTIAKSIREYQRDQVKRWLVQVGREEFGFSVEDSNHDYTSKLQQEQRQSRQQGKMAVSAVHNVARGGHTATRRLAFIKNNENKRTNNNRQQRKSTTLAKTLRMSQCDLTKRWLVKYAGREEFNF